MQTFTAATASVNALDSSKHVNYTPGMVLGVDDFSQEFAFHNGRNEWLLRDLIGYGTASGLQVRFEDRNGKRQVRVTSGVAISPRGQMIRVCSDQCADLDQWLANKTNQDQVAASLSMLGSPPSPSLSLYLTLCYRECPADSLPIPGEPCRSEDDAMAPSRLKSDFALELRFVPPDQREEDVLRRMLTWVRQIPLTTGAVPGSPPDTSLTDLLDAIRQVASDAFTSPPSSPPLSPPDIFVGSPPSALSIPVAMASEYWRAVFLLWVTELRPMWQARFAVTSACGCGQKGPVTEHCVLLAELKLPLVTSGGNQWQLAGPADVIEEQRPYLLHLRVLQEWSCAGGSSGLSVSEEVTHPPGVGSYRILAAGIIKGDSSARQPTYNGLRFLPLSAPAGAMLLTFDGYNQPVSGLQQYILKAMPTSASTPSGVTLLFDQFLPGGVQLLATDASGAAIANPKALEYMVEVSQFFA